MKEAIHITTETINLRMKWYRNIIVGGIGIVLITMVWAIVLMSWRFLLGWLLLLPLCGAFLYIDCRLTNKWQERILEMWIQGTLDLNMFCDTMSQVRMFPKRMLQGMMNTLPIHPDPVISKNMNPDIRRSLSLTLQTLNACQNDRTIFASLAFTLALFSLAMAVILKSWIYLVGLSLTPLVIGVSMGFRTIRLKPLREHLTGFKGEKTGEFEKFIESAVHLDWGCIPKKKKAQLLST